jgi:peptidyl-prolyl cis-trans isomerase SurA
VSALFLSALIDLSESSASLLVVCGGRLKTNSRLLTALCGLTTLVLCIAPLTGCNKQSGGGSVVATVDGRKIYRSDLDKYYDNQVAGSNQNPTGEQATSLRLNILHGLIDNEILMHRAEKLGLLATDDEVERKLDEIKSPFTNDQFLARLAERKLTLDEFKQNLRRSLTVDKVINKEVTSKVNITDQDITKYYNENKAQFNLIEPRYHLAQIVVTTSPSGDVHNLKNDKAQNEAEARRKIQMIENRLDSGDDFATLAMNFSEDPDTAANGGDLGFAPESSLKSTDEATRDAVLKLKVGDYTTAPIQIVNPMTKQFIGFRIVKLLAKEPAGQRELTNPQVQQAIHEQLRDRREQLLKAAYYEVLRDQAKVENYFAQQIIDSNGTLE